MKRYLTGALVSLLVTACGNGEQFQRDYPDAGSVGEKALQKHCSACHGAPLPSTHSADEWQAVVYRMTQHMMMKSFDPVPGRELDALLAYLRSYGR